MKRKAINFTFTYVKMLLAYLMVTLGDIYFFECADGVCAWPDDERLIGIMFFATLCAYIFGILNEGKKE